MSLMSPSAHATVVAPPNATSASRIASAIRFIDLTSLLAIETRPAWARVAPTFVGGESDDGAANHSCGLSDRRLATRATISTLVRGGGDAVVGRARASPERDHYVEQEDATCATRMQAS